MDPLIPAAAHALATGNPLGALKRVSLRNDAPALALRGIAIVTGVTWVDGELWHATFEGDESELRCVDPRSFCGGENSGKVRTIRRPKRRRSA